MKILPFALLSAFLFWGLAAALAQTPASRTSLPANAVFQKNRARCHGPSAKGHFLGAPSLVSAKAASISPEELRAIIANGKGWFPLHRMPKFSGDPAACERSDHAGVLHQDGARRCTLGHAAAREGAWL